MRAGLAALSLTIASMLPALAHAAPPVDLVLFDGAPRQGVTVAAVAPDTEHVLVGERVDADAGLRAKFPGSAIELARSEGPDGGGALTLRWNKIWKSGLRLSGPSFDLRPYLAGGTLAFDLRVDALDKGGILFRVGCGEDCERHVSYVLPGRAAQG